MGAPKTLIGNIYIYNSSLNWKYVYINNSNWDFFWVGNIHNYMIPNGTSGTDTLRHIATRSGCKLLHHTSTHCNTLQHTSAKYCGTPQHSAALYNILQHTAAHCHALQQLNTLQLEHTATFCNTLQHTATHRHTMQHTATPWQCKTLAILRGVPPPLRQIQKWSHIRK